MDAGVLQALARAHIDRAGMESLSLTNKDANRLVGIGCGMDKTILKKNCDGHCNAEGEVWGVLSGLNGDVRVINTPNLQCVILCLLTRGKSGGGETWNSSDFHPTFRKLILHETFQELPMSDETAVCVFRPVVSVRLNVGTTEFMQNLINRKALSNLIEVSMNQINNAAFDLTSLRYLRNVHIAFMTPTTLSSTRHKIPQFVLDLSLRNINNIEGNYTLDVAKLHLHSLRDTTAALRKIMFRNMPLSKLSLQGQVEFPLPNVSALYLDVSYTDRTVQQLFDASINFTHINAAGSLDIPNRSGTIDQILGDLSDNDRILLAQTGPHVAPPRAHIRLSHSEFDADPTKNVINFMTAIKMRPVVEAVNLRI